MIRRNNDVVPYLARCQSEYPASSKVNIVNQPEAWLPLVTLGISWESKAKRLIFNIQKLISGKGILVWGVWGVVI